MSLPFDFMWGLQLLPGAWAVLVLWVSFGLAPDSTSSARPRSSWVGRLRWALRGRRKYESEIARELPEVIELLSLALAGGGSIQQAVETVALIENADGAGRPVSKGLAAVPGAVATGHRFSEALEQVGESLGPQVKPVIRALLGSDRYGTAIRPTLERLAQEARERRRRSAQAAARKLPIRMLLPLVLGVLPAFVLLTIVPVLAGTLEGLNLTSPATQ